MYKQPKTHAKFLEELKEYISANKFECEIADKRCYDIGYFTDAVEADQLIKLIEQFEAQLSGDKNE